MKSYYLLKLRYLSQKHAIFIMSISRACCEVGCICKWLNAGFLNTERAYSASFLYFTLINNYRQCNLKVCSIFPKEDI
jgi:hypothetical protein